MPSQILNVKTLHDFSFPSSIQCIGLWLEIKKKYQDKSCISYAAKLLLKKFAKLLFNCNLLCNFYVKSLWFYNLSITVRGWFALITCGKKSVATFYDRRLQILQSVDIAEEKGQKEIFKGEWCNPRIKKSSCF